LRRQLEKETQRHEERIDANEEKVEFDSIGERRFEQQQPEQPLFYRPYHHSHFEQKRS